jgi:hypothetical protein
MRRLSLLVPALSLLFSVSAIAADYRVAPLKEGPPKDELPADLASQLSSTGIRVVRGVNTPYCDIWLCRELEVAADAKLPPMVHFPFRQGQFMGVVRYERSGADFRDQKIAKGIYTLRFALQPTDGAHEGVFPTRDFLLLVRPEKDKSPADIKDFEALSKLSEEAVESSHPGFLCLKQPVGQAKEPLSIRHDADADWWIVRFSVKTKAGGVVKDTELELVVSGHAKE